MIYLVCGRTGEYDDYREWRVAYSKDEKFAQELANHLQHLSDNIDRSEYSITGYYQGEKELKVIDPCYQYDCLAPTEYFVEEIPEIVEF